MSLKFMATLTLEVLKFQLAQHQLTELHMYLLGSLPCS